MLTAMVFLLVLTLLALTAVRRATQGENIAKNMGEQNIAFQTAETALRYCQKEIEQTLAGDTSLPLATSQTALHGVPINRYTGGAPEFFLPDLWRTKTNLVAKGYKLPANTIEKVSDQPQCIIEEWRKPTSQGFTRKKNAGTGIITAFVTTVRAQGANAKSVVWLQQTWFPGGN
ncbi:type IV pilus assembly protein PilX [Undibacterium pigrum]|uniref:Type IV pilus assembly protein PilX n=2 Tax=Undibacterium pigrum TaxID=401470 RepID=A0A318J1C4_9BURK|nr:type IV pilus assembly protein PilX [Undibacterium pigrum]